jgi:hypothetical protein
MYGNMNRTEILQMVESGQLSAVDAAARLAAPQKPAIKPVSTMGQMRWLHVRVTNLHSGRPKVSVNLPMSLVQAGLSLGARFAPELDDLDWQTIVDALNGETEGKIVEVEDLEEGERVEVYVD